MFWVTRAVPDTVFFVFALTATLPPFSVLVSMRVVPSMLVLALACAKSKAKAMPMWVAA